MGKLANATALGGELAAMHHDKLASYPSLYLARCSSEHEFPHHDTKVKKGNEADADLARRMAEKQGQMRRLALELAQLEIDLKKRIGFNEGIEIPGIGILFWTNRRGARRSRIDWMKLVEDHGISEEKLKTYRREDGGRRLILKPKAHGPQGIAHLAPANTGEIGLDDDF